MIVLKTSIPGMEPKRGKVRDWLTATSWDKNSPPPELPDEIVEKTRLKYIEAFEIITGKKFDSK